MLIEVKQFGIRLSSICVTRVFYPASRYVFYVCERSSNIRIEVCFPSRFCSAIFSLIREIQAIVYSGGKAREMKSLKSSSCIYNSVYILSLK